MRFRKLDRYLLVLAVLFVLAVLRRGDVPGEEMLPDAYRVAIHRPLLAPLVGATNEEAARRIELESRLEVAQREIAQLKDQLTNRAGLETYFGTIEWERPPKATPAWVFAVDADPFRRHFQIDRGTRSGVRAGHAVVVGRALLGVAVAATANITTVRRIDDPSFLIEVEIETSEGVAAGIAQGDADRGLEVRFVRLASALREGDAVFTSRYDAKVPPGLLVGHVSAIRDLDQDGLHEVTVAPTAMLGRWAQVEVLEAVARPTR